MTTDKTPPAPCDAPVLGEAEMKAIIDLARINSASGKIEDWIRFATVAGNSIMPALNTIDILTARLRAAEERERTLTEALAALLADVGVPTPFEGDAVEHLLLRPAECSAVDVLAASSQRAGDGGGTQ